MKRTNDALAHSGPANAGNVRAANDAALRWPFGRRRCGPRSGFTVLELSISSLVLLLFTGTIVETLGSMRSGALNARVEDRAQEYARRAIDSIVDDLSYSGLISAGGRSYPLLFDDGAIDPDYDTYDLIAHDPALENSKAGRDDFGVNREIVMLHPADVDGDGVPDIADIVDGQLVWDDAQPISYTLETDLSGDNVLIRRQGNTSERIVARGVERVRFLNSQDTGFQIPLDAVRVELHLMLFDDNGHAYRYRAETTVRMRNGAST
ncbi:hypothetical protein Pla163_15850 [Planctomycetes bacterium Pla163]|uniref:Prepilin-type N-terminal cleavage/methylation domain-containing protein n=1 Tax=Rohdeia mirabilis TaxID=2528008 RepID=A0A518CZ59_9BACT|nr:hypothetical protein Pla163_15850 [Planctomycetes bacterium Pla163]